ncbi:hypothetical protein M1394_02200 [Candidatus Marsarchaeota archaeon]|nr:hypothetical protein [Candidatus Marsarchaeota archaeon]
MEISKKIRLAIYLVFISGVVANLLGLSLSAQSSVDLLTSNLCNVVNTVRTVVGIFALVLFVVGGVLYAAAHFLPSAGNLRSGLQGWSLGMIMGGIIGLILVLAAPWIVSTVAGFGSSISSISGC